MKKSIAIILIFLLILGMIGCSEKETIHFYYLRTEVQYDVSQGVITAEEREIEGANRSLEYMLKLYLEGPVSQSLRSPFPKGTALTHLAQTGNSLVVTLSPPFGMLENMDYVIACACVASTCFALTDAQSVTIATGQTEMTLTRDNLTINDQPSPAG